VALLSNGSFSVEERDGNEIHFEHDGKFDNVTVPVLRGLRQGEERIEFEYEYREGQFRVRHAKVMQEGLSSPPYSIRYDYAPDGRLATITGPDGRVSEIHYTGSTTSITGGTPLRITEARSKKDVAEMLRQCGVSIHDAAKDGDLARVQALLNLDPSLVSSRDDRGNSPLHWAAFGGHKDIAELLLANKADVNAKDNNGVTPLHDAAGTGRTDVAELLLVHQALVNARSNVGATPLHNAAGNGHVGVAELLLAHGGDVNAKGDGDLTPLHNAAFAGAKDVAALLLSHNAEINARSAKGNTPLGIAKQEGQSSIEELLRQHGGRE
jgi:ankyrin repeat protein